VSVLDFFRLADPPSLFGGEDTRRGVCVGSGHVQKLLGLHSQEIVGYRVARALAIKLSLVAGMASVPYVNHS
jgi:hypothetical protein